LPRLIFGDLFKAAMAEFDDTVAGWKKWLGRAALVVGIACMVLAYLAWQHPKPVMETEAEAREKLLHLQWQELQKLTPTPMPRSEELATPRPSVPLVSPKPETQKTSADRNGD
jgi:hypothetical protein